MKRLDEIFTVTYGVNLELYKLIESDSPNSINFVSRTKRNNGVSARVLKLEDVNPNPAHTLSISLTGSVLEVFYQEEEYYSGRDIAYLTPIEPMDKFTMLMYCAIIKANQYKYSQGRGANKTVGSIMLLEKEELSQYKKYSELPSIEDIPDYFLNEGYERACWYISNIDAIKFEDKYASPKKKSNKIRLRNTAEWKPFRMEELFDIKKGVRLTKANQLPGDHPFIGASGANNGITGYIGQSPIHEGNTISLTYNGSIGEAFFQPNPFWASDDVNVLHLKNYELNPYIAFFLCTILRLESHLWSYARKWNVEQMRKTYIKLPVDDKGDPDYHYMEDYIKGCAFSCNIE